MIRQRIAHIAVLGVFVLTCTSWQTRAGASTVMVIDDLAPLRTTPSNQAPIAADAPLGLLLSTERIPSPAEFVQVTSAERRRLEEPKYHHPYIRPHSYLDSWGKTHILLDLILFAKPASAPLSTRRYKLRHFLTDHESLPDSFYVAIGNPNDQSRWGSEVVTLPPRSAHYDPPGIGERKSLLRAQAAYQFAVILSSSQSIRSVCERIAAARVIVRRARCGDVEYVGTDIGTIVDRSRSVGAARDTILVPVTEDDLAAASNGHSVLWTRLVYVADVFFADGTSETIARRMVVTWPLCP